jgi:serine/threonine protein phosphatase 1
MILSRFRRSRADAGQARAAVAESVPEGTLVYAIGDVHGRLDLLQDLLGLISDDATGRDPVDMRVVLLGDLIDRGPHSHGVIEYLSTLVWDPALPSFIAGNHEEMMLAALDGNLETMRFWMRNGGEETMLSYGVTRAMIERGDAHATMNAFAALVPPHHLKFLRQMVDHVAIGDYLFVHAGIRPGVPLEKQKTSDLRWIRDSFLDHIGSHGAVVVHGHTIFDRVDEQPNRIGIDTGAYASGTLTALALSGQERWYLST